MFVVCSVYRLILNNIIRFIMYSRLCTIICLFIQWFNTCDIPFLVRLIMNIWSGLSCSGRISVATRSLSVLLTKFICSANSVCRGWWVLIFCCGFWNCEVWKHMLNVLIDIGFLKRPLLLKVYIKIPLRLVRSFEM